MIFERALNQFTTKPKRLFLIDGFGALLSTFFLGFVLVKLERYFGIPKSTLYILALFPALFAVYDFYCYRIIRKDIVFYLRAVAIMNLLYCGLSIGFMIYHYRTITSLGWTYIILEILIVSSLAILELKTANQLNNFE